MQGMTNLDHPSSGPSRENTSGGGRTWNRGAPMFRKVLPCAGEYRNNDSPLFIHRLLLLPKEESEAEGRPRARIHLLQ